MSDKLAGVDSTAIKHIWQQVEGDVRRATRLEVAAQAVTRTLFDAYGDSVVLARAFVTVPYSELPGDNLTFVRGLAEKTGVAAALAPTTPVLSLIGTSGTEPDWCDRRRSTGHVGIPLVSSEFVDEIPMLSRLLKELGMDLAWIDRGDTDIIAKALGSSTGVSYVAEASQELDRRGRKVIAAQDFVAAHRVRTVFGFGGAYFGGAIVLFIVFCRDAIDRSVAQRFAPLANLFKAATVPLAGASTVFAAD